MGETSKRVVSGALIAAAFIFSISYQGMYMVLLYAFTLTFAIIGILEYYRLVEAKVKEKIPKTVGVVATVVLLTFVWLSWQAKFYVEGQPLFNATVKDILKVFQMNYAILGGMIYVLLVFVLLLQLLKNRVENSLTIIAAYIFSVIYLPFTFSHLFLLYGLEQGLFYVWLVAWATAMADTGGYFMGKAFGKNKVGFAVSPNKTWEGYILGAVMQNALVIGFYLVAQKYFTVPEYSIFQISLFGVVIYVTSVLGDLAESLFKRDAGIKDSGNLIPGHGGVLDLLDAMLITIPAAYYYFYTIQQWKTL